MIARGPAAALAAVLATAGCDRDDSGPAPAPAPGPAIQIVGDTVKHRQGDPLPRRSAIFDGHRVDLRAARGETLGVQVLVRDGARDAELELDAPGVTTRGFRVRDLTVDEPSSSMYGPSRGPGAYPDILVPAGGPVPVRHAALFDVAVARAAAPGRYRGELRVGDRSFPVSLEVESAAIDIGSAPLVWCYYDPGELARAHGARGDSLLDRERSYAELLRRHGAYLASDLPPEDFDDRAFLLDDSIRYWPVYIQDREPQLAAAQARRWIEIFEDRPQTPFAIPIDEPLELSEKLLVTRNGAFLHAAAGGRPDLLHGVTDRARTLYGDTVDVFISPDSIPPPDGMRARGIRFWTYNGRPPEAGSMIIDTHGTALRTWGWIAHRYDVELWYVWESLYFTDRYNGAEAPTDLMTEPVTYDERRRGGEDWGNGDGLLVYPGPRPSLRLKALRRGLQDRLLLAALERCDAAKARRIARRLIPRALGEAREEVAWPWPEPPWEQARRAVLDALESCDVDD